MLAQREHLLGIHELAGIEDATDRVHDLEVIRAEQERQLLGLVEADAVLPGDLPPSVDAGAEHFLVRLHGALELAGIRSS